MLMALKAMVLCATIAGMSWKPEWFVCNWDSPVKVSIMGFLLLMTYDEFNMYAIACCNLFELFVRDFKFLFVCLFLYAIVF